MTTMKLEMVLPHITEYVAANKWMPLAKLKTKMIDVDIIGECWLRAMTADTGDARQVRLFYDNFTCDEAQARQRIVWLVRSYVKNELQKITTRKELEMKNPEAILENTMSQATASARSMTDVVLLVHTAAMLYVALSSTTIAE